MSRFTSKCPRPGLAAGWGEQKGDQKSVNHFQGALGTLICLEEIPARLQDPHTTPNTRPGPGPAWHRRPLVPAARPRSPRPGLGSPHPRGTPPSGPGLRAFGAGERVRREKASGGGGRHSWEGYLTSHRGRRCVCTSLRHSQGKTSLCFCQRVLPMPLEKVILSFYIADIPGSREDGAPLC